MRWWFIGLLFIAVALSCMNTPLMIINPEVQDGTLTWETTVPAKCHVIYCDQDKCITLPCCDPDYVKHHSQVIPQVKRLEIIAESSNEVVHAEVIP